MSQRSTRLDQSVTEYVGLQEDFDELRLSAGQDF